MQAYAPLNCGNFLTIFFYENERAADYQLPFHFFVIEKPVMPYTIVNIGDSKQKKVNGK